MREKPEPRFDLDYAAGRQQEMWVEGIRDSLAADSIEVKLDREFVETGNIFIEYACKGKNGWDDSGLAKTTSKLWIQVLVEGELALIVSTERLKEIARRYWDRRAECKRGSHPTKGVLIPAAEIVALAAKRRPRATQ